MMEVNIMNSCHGLTLLERKISTSTSALEREIIFNLLSLTAEIKENHSGVFDFCFLHRLSCFTLYCHICLCKKVKTWYICPL